MATQATTIPVTGKSGVKYQFWEHPLGTSYKKIGGVYIFIKKGGNGTTAIYIGKTNDLSERFDNHHKMACIKRNGATHLLTRVVENESDRDAMEKDLLAAINTTCNEVNN